MILMHRVKLIIKTGFAYSFWALSFILLSFIGPFFALLPKSIRYDNRLYYRFNRFCSNLFIYPSFLQLRITDIHNLPAYPTTPAIIVINHSSALDIPIVANILNAYPHIWISKDTYGKIPFFGFVMKRLNVLVNRESPASGRQALLTAINLVQNKNRHVVIFPEGRRFGDGRIHKFHAGFAILASKLNRPVIPVLVQGLNSIYPKNSYLINSELNPVNIVIGEPMFYNKPQETSQEFVTRVQNWFESQIEKRTPLK